MPPKRAGRTKIKPVLEPLPADRFYAGVKKKSGPVRKKLAERLRAPPKRVDNPYKPNPASEANPFRGCQTVQDSRHKSLPVEEGGGEGEV